MYYFECIYRHILALIFKELKHMRIAKCKGLIVLIGYFGRFQQSYPIVLLPCTQWLTSELDGL